MVLLDPLKSAEPPIILEESFVTHSITPCEQFLVAILGFDSKYFSFSLIIKFSSSFKLKFCIKFFNSSLIFSLFLSNVSFHFFSNSIPFFPISLHEFKTSLGIENGSLFHFNFFLTNEISSFPKGEP